MGDRSEIEWCDATWNPVRGCSRISPGCEHCYAETMAARFAAEGQPFHGFAQPGGKWTRKVALIPSMLDAPLHWKKPRRIFVNSMSDLFHEKLEWLEIGRVFEVMEKCPQHTFQILTKRADRMREYMQVEYATAPPPRNVWLGVSVEDQQRADERISHLLHTPAAVRFLSVEPLLGPVDFSRWLIAGGSSGIDWVIVGGESGSGARSMRPEWARSIVKQCKAAGVACFVKQLGSRPSYLAPAPGGLAHLDLRQRLRDHKGGDPSEWPADLRVREFPEPRR